MITNKQQILSESKYEFESIINSNLSKNCKLNELVKLRNYLKETYILSQKYEGFNCLLQDVEEIISEIDASWWKMFTKQDYEKWT